MTGGDFVWLYSTLCVSHYYLWIKGVEFQGGVRKNKQETEQWSEMRDLSKQLGRTMAVHSGDAFGSHLPEVKNFQS